MLKCPAKTLTVHSNGCVQKGFKCQLAGLFREEGISTYHPHRAINPIFFLSNISYKEF